MEINDFTQSAGRRLFRYVFGYVQPIDSRLRSCPFHHHFYIELVYHKKGSGTTALDSGKKVPFEEGSIVMYPPGMVHNQLNDVAGAIDCVIHLEACDDGLLDVKECRYVAPRTAGRHCVLFEELSSAGCPAGDAGEMGLSLKASYLMFELMQGSSPERSGVNPQSSEAVARTAYDHIREHYRSIGRLPEMALRLGVDYDIMRKAFSRHYGMPLKQWVIQVRIRQARVLLRNTVLAQREIADLCGYGDLQHFCADFRKQTGVTPGTFRRKEKAGAV